MMTVALSWMIPLTLSAMAGPTEPFCEKEFLFDRDKENRGHVHASCLVACPNGDLLATWYENGPSLPEPFFSEERDKSDDVRIAGARKRAGASSWETPFVMMDTFGLSDNNPFMVIDPQGRLWLFYSTLLLVPKVAWGSGLMQVAISEDYQGDGSPRWSFQSVLMPRPLGMDEAFVAPMEKGKPKESEDERQKRIEWAKEQLKDLQKVRLGWMGRAHPLILSDGTLLAPLANENLGIAAMAMTRDSGKTWQFSNAVPDRGLTQPTVVSFSDGLMQAYFRNGRPQHRILRSESRDGGMTWSAVTQTDLPHPESGIEGIVLQNGHLLMIYNDREKDGRDRLAVSISTDRGESWRFTRHLEDSPGQRFDYPSVIQRPDGSLHATYSYNVQCIKHAHFNEAWVEKGD